MKKYFIPSLIVFLFIVGFTIYYIVERDKEKTPVNEIEEVVTQPKSPIEIDEPITTFPDVVKEIEVLIPEPEPQIEFKPDPDPEPQPVVSTSDSCNALSIPSDYTEVIVDSVDALYKAVTDANVSGRVVVTIKAGTYTLYQPLWVSGSDIVFRGATGTRGDVIVRGDGMYGSVASSFQIAGDRVTVADLTVGYVTNHPIQVHGELDADDVRIHNVHFIDGYQQLLKGSYTETNGVDRGIVECSRFEYSVGIGPNWYIGGIDVHNGKDWIVRDNVFLNIRSPQEDLAEHAIHFWSNSQNTRVERNTIINCDRGIGFGLGDRGHIGGLIQDNFIYHDSTRADVGIGLESAKNAEVARNHIYFEHEYPNAIEYRFEATTGVNIHDNVTNRSITARDGASGTVTQNTTNATKEMFAVELKKWGSSAI